LLGGAEQKKVKTYTDSLSMDRNLNLIPLEYEGVPTTQPRQTVKYCKGFDALFEATVGLTHSFSYPSTLNSSIPSDSSTHVWYIGGLIEVSI
jgi:hypothetical protein